MKFLALVTLANGRVPASLINRSTRPFMWEIKAGWMLQAVGRALVSGGGRETYNWSMFP